MDDKVKIIILVADNDSGYFAANENGVIEGSVGTLDETLMSVGFVGASGLTCADHINF